MSKDDDTKITDGTKCHVWMFEPQASSKSSNSHSTGVLTESGVEAIAAHKYKPGHYTYLDNMLNPVWTSLTELLPLWVAPNMVVSLMFASSNGKCQLPLTAHATQPKTFLSSRCANRLFWAHYIAD